MSDISFVRLCSFVADGILTIEDEGDMGYGIPSMAGGLGETLRYFMEFVSHGLPQFNRTIIKESEFGTRNDDGSFTGCAGSIQRNESDFAIGIAQYPLDDYYNVYPFQVVTEGKIIMLSSYNITPGSDATDLVGDATRLIEPTAYVCSACVLLFLALLFKIFTIIRRNQLLALKGFKRFKRLTRERKERIVYEFYATFMGQEADFVDSYNSSRKILLMLVSILSFFLLEMFANMISTDSVVAKKAEVINNYADFLRRPNMTPFFMEMFSDHHEFKFARPGSNAKKIWKKIDPKKIHEYVIADASLSKMIQVSRLIRAGQGVFFVNSYAADFCINTMSRLRFQGMTEEQMKRYRLRAWKSSDPEATIRQMGAAMRTQFRETLIGRKIIRNARTMIEAGAEMKFKKEIDKGMMRHLGDPPGMRDYASSTVVVEEVESDCQTRIYNIALLLKIYSWTAMAAFILVAAERLCDLAKKRNIWYHTKKWITRSAMRMYSALMETFTIQETRTDVNGDEQQ